MPEFPVVRKSGGLHPSDPMRPSAPPLPPSDNSARPSRHEPPSRYELWWCPVCDEIPDEVSDPCQRCGSTVLRRQYVSASRGFPWPCPADIKAAAAAIAKKREQIAGAHVFNSMIDPPGPPRPMTDMECVLQVLWSLRGDA